MQKTEQDILQDYLSELNYFRVIMRICNYSMRQLSQDLSIDPSNLTRLFKGKHIPSVLTFLIIKKQIMQVYYNYKLTQDVLSAPLYIESN